MSELREYIVTARNRDVVDDLCADIESPGGNLYIPNRRVECVNLRPVSRNTHYMLTDEEAQQLRQDPRVEAVTKTMADLGIKVRRTWDQYSTGWNKYAINASFFNFNKNWGLMRCTNGSNVYKINSASPYWGGPPPVNSSSALTGTASTGANAPTGANVDVVIVDGIFLSTHPEFAVNADGTGGTRVVQYNWFALNPQVTGGAAGNYDYTIGDPGNFYWDDEQHGCHVAGTACGNTQGWARDANIYNINFVNTFANPMDPTVLFDYIRVFHNTKAVNPGTGVKNPTIANNSWGFFYALNLSDVSSVVQRGVVTSGPFTSGQLAAFGFNNINFGEFTIPARYAPYEADIYDAIDDGVILVGAAGNDSIYMDVPGGLDYNNYLTLTSDPGYEYYYNQGGAPTAVDTFINVGSMSSQGGEYKADSSNTGPRIDIWAPGENIISSFTGPLDYNNPGSTSNMVAPGFPGYYLGVQSGTSMASPQVTGILACQLELNPSWTQDDARAWLVAYSTKNQMLSGTGGITDVTDLNGATNQILAWADPRPTDVQAYPNNTASNRLSGIYVKMAWPRPSIRR